MRNRRRVCDGNRTDTVRLPEDRTEFEFELPDECRGSNLVVELVAEGRRKTQPHYDHELLVQVIEPYGQVRVTRRAGGPLSTVYVKVYARMNGGSVKFFKDGYTDLRGRFDYTSLNTNELDHVDRLALLVLSEEHGAVICEAAPPGR